MLARGYSLAALDAFVRRPDGGLELAVSTASRAGLPHGMSLRTPARPSSTSSTCSRRGSDWASAASSSGASRTLCARRRVDAGPQRQQAQRAGDPRLRPVWLHDPRGDRRRHRPWLRDGRLRDGDAAVTLARLAGAALGRLPDAGPILLPKRMPARTLALRQLHAHAAPVRAARPGRRGRPVHLRADGLRLPAHRQLPDVPVRGRAEARARVERLPRPARDEHHRRRPPHLRRRHRRGQDGEGRAAHRQDGVGDRRALHRRVPRRPEAPQHRGADGAVPGDRPHPPSRSTFIADIEKQRLHLPDLRRHLLRHRRSSPDYGYLARLDVEGLEAGRRVEHRREAQPDRLRAVEVLARRARSARWSGTARGAGASRAGTSSARRWRRSTSATTSTSTAAARTTSPSTTRTRSRRPRRASARGSRTSGCTATSCCRTTRRWRSRPASSCASSRSSTAATIRSPIATSA